MAEDGIGPRFSVGLDGVGDGLAEDLGRGVRGLAGAEDEGEGSEEAPVWRGGAGISVQFQRGRRVKRGQKGQGTHELSSGTTCSKKKGSETEGSADAARPAQPQPLHAYPVDEPAPITLDAFWLPPSTRFAIKDEISRI